MQFLGEVDFGGVHARGGLDLRNSLFVGRADFDGINSDGDVDLSNAIFLGNLSIVKAEIRGKLVATHMHCLREFALLQTVLEGGITFRQSAFYGPCGFEETRFGGEVSVAYCHFLNLVSLSNTTFDDDVTFVNCRFVAEDVTLSGRCNGAFGLIACVLQSVLVGFVWFGKSATFAGSRFRDSAMFQNIIFRDKASFLNVVFESDVRFDDVTFLGHMEFHNALFVGVADMGRCNFPADPAFFHAAFRGAEFRRIADFTNEHFIAWGAFAGTRFSQHVRFAPAALRTDASFKYALKAVGPTNAAISDQRFADLESAFQILKVAMATQQARLEEQRLYRFELIARRSQRATPWPERTLSLLYGATSVYGTSAGRPAAWLLFMTIVFGALFWAISRTPVAVLTQLWPWPVRELDPDFISAISFALRNVFQPFSVWTLTASGNSPSDAWLSALLNDHGAARMLLTRALATLQSLVSALLLFLVGLAIKRRFQIT